MARIEQRLSALGLVLPPVVQAPAGVVLPFSFIRLVGNRAFISGHGPQNPDGSIAGPRGKLGRELSVEQGYAAARLTALSILGSLKRALGDLDRISAWVRVFGMVNSAPGFNQQPSVINGFSDLILQLYGHDIGAHSRSESGVFPIILRLSRMRSEEMQIMEKAKEAIRFVGLEDHMNAITGILPLGTQRLVEMARALMCEPKLLFLDEVTTGLNFHEKQKVIRVLQKIREQGTTIFIVAHDMSFVMELSSKIYVLNFGKKIAEGSPEEIRKNREVIDVYLGRTETNS